MTRRAPVHLRMKEGPQVSNARPAGEGAIIWGYYISGTTGGEANLIEQNETVEFTLVARSSVYFNSGIYVKDRDKTFGSGTLELWQGDDLLSSYQFPVIYTGAGGKDMNLTAVHTLDPGTYRVVWSGQGGDDDNEWEGSISIIVGPAQDVDYSRPES